MLISSDSWPLLASITVFSDILTFLYETQTRASCRSAHMLHLRMRRKGGIGGLQYVLRSTVSYPQLCVTLTTIAA